MNTSIVKKLFVLIAAVSILRIISGCGDCPDDPVFFEFNEVSISNLDNSGAWSQVTTSDSMFDEAVSFRVMIDGYFEPVKFQSSFLRNTGYSSCYAFSKCPEILKPLHPITALTIKTLYPINNEIPANSDVSNMFVASESSWGNLYHPLTSHTVSLKDKIYYDFSESFNIYLKSKVLNDKARFIISVRLDNDSIISDTTNIIYIKAGK
ncbi:MAG TPA: hypothetical protein PK796_08840 [Bacteroidales bacterium]|jgi:hypothetical protein|nr:hypothetical protein [Bacteroidales bacterium]